MTRGLYSFRLTSCTLPAPVSAAGDDNLRNVDHTYPVLLVLLPKASLNQYQRCCLLYFSSFPHQDGGQNHKQTNSLFLTRNQHIVHPGTQQPPSFSRHPGHFACHPHPVSNISYYFVAAYPHSNHRAVCSPTPATSRI